MANLLTVVLAAGKGTRMKSELPKVLHRVGGKPMVQHVLDAANRAGSEKNIVVVGFGGEAVREAVGGFATFVEQKEQLGTGHAVMQAQDALRGFDGTVMVLCGDAPLLSGELLERLYADHKRAGAQATVLTAKVPDPAGYGRIVRDASDTVKKIVEHKDATDAERAVDEINTAMYCFECAALLSALGSLTADNAAGEYLLTDVIEILNAKGEKVCAVIADDYRETLGINSRAQLAEAESILRGRKLAQLMDAGVTVMDPASTFVDPEVEIGQDTVLYPFTWLEGKTKVGSNCAVGPNSRFTDTVIGNDVTVQFTYGHECEIGDRVTIGPYVHLRPKTKLAAGVKVGNFVEVKNSTVGEGTKLPHLTYIGDSDIGAGVNMGCGTITVNYDGKGKYRTTIEDHAFVGCNTNLVAPVTVGEGSYIGAGSTITKNVPPAALGIGRARQTNIEGWTSRGK